MEKRERKKQRIGNKDADKSLSRRRCELLIFMMRMHSLSARVLETWSRKEGEHGGLRGLGLVSTILFQESRS